MRLCLQNQASSLEKSARDITLVLLTLAHALFLLHVNLPGRQLSTVEICVFMNVFINTRQIISVLKRQSKVTGSDRCNHI